MSKKKFHVTLTLVVDEDNGHLSTFPDNHEDDIKELLEAHFYDLDDVLVKDLEVEEDE